MSDDGFDPQRLIKLAKQTLSSAERRRKYRAIDFLDTSFWYPTQLKFFAAGSSGVSQRMLYAGNQQGKSLAVAAEVAWHATGDYPNWWTGKRFSKPPLIWVVSESVIVGRDTAQKKLCGDDFGTGLVALENFTRKPIMIAGGMNAVDTLFVAHVDTDGNPDGTSTIVLKTYEQRREKLQGADGVTYKYLSEYSSDRAASRANRRVTHDQMPGRRRCAREQLRIDIKRRLLTHQMKSTEALWCSRSIFFTDMSTYSASRRRRQNTFRQSV